MTVIITSILKSSEQNAILITGIALSLWVC